MLNPEIGHNHPPSDVELLVERLGNESLDIIKRADELAAGAGRCVITDQHTAGLAAKLGGMLMTARETVEHRQKTAKAPYFALSNAAFDFFKPTLAKVNDALARVKRTVEAWDADQERKAAAERRRLQDEARAAQAEADRLVAEAKTETDIDQAIALEEKADLATVTALTIAAPEIRSDLGQLATPRRDWKHRITDSNLVPRHLLMLNEPAVKAHIKARVKDQPPGDVPGLEFFQEKTIAFKR